MIAMGSNRVDRITGGEFHAAGRRPAPPLRVCPAGCGAGWTGRPRWRSSGPSPPRTGRPGAAMAMDDCWRSRWAAPVRAEGARFASQRQCLCRFGPSKRGNAAVLSAIIPSMRRGPLKNTEAVSFHQVSGVFRRHLLHFDVVLLVAHRNYIDTDAFLFLPLALHGDIASGCSAMAKPPASLPSRSVSPQPPPVAAAREAVTRAAPAAALSRIVRALAKQAARAVFAEASATQSSQRSSADFSREL
jgi:hypothetical protein